MNHRGRWLAALGAVAALTPGALSGVSVVGNQGPSTGSTPYVVPSAPGVRTVSILTTGESVSPKLDGTTPYRMLGLPDGLGAYDNGDGTFTLLANHEFGSGSGTVRAHGSVGASVSAWKIDRSTLAVTAGGDLVRTVMTWDFAAQKWVAGTTAFNRFCSADLGAPTAFFNAATGKGTLDRLFMDGEENAGGRAFVHVASGPDAGISYEFPRMGRDAWENVSACPFAQDRTIAIGQDDTSSPGGQVYVYVGTKATTGNQLQKAGLAGGTLYAVLANATRNEDRTLGINTVKGAAAPFTLLSLGDPSAAGFNTEAAADAAGATEFLRPEDGCWDPSHPSDYYFVTTDRFDSTKNGSGATVGRSRLWRLRFADLANPESGGTIAMLLDGSEPHNMFDNLCVSRTGFVMLQEDVGGNAWTGRIWRYEIATGNLVECARHDPARFGSEAIAPTAPFSNDEESSGIIDASDLLGTGWFLLDVQAHYAIGDPELVEGGQFLALYDPATAAAPAALSVTANPEQSTTGQAVSFAASASIPGGGALVYSWEFGDGSQGAGASVQHAFAASGTYDVSCTVLDPATGLSAQGSAQVLVFQNILGSSLEISLDFAREAKDALSLKGQMAVPAGLVPAGEEVSVLIGSIERSFTLDAKGRGSAADGTFALVLKKQGDQVANFTMNLKGASLQGGLAPLGLADDDVEGTLVNVPVEVVFHGTTWRSHEVLYYQARAGKRGSAK